MMASENEAPETPAAAPRKKPSTGGAWANLAIDYGPVLVFFIAYRLMRPASAGANGAQSIGEVIAVSKSTLVFIAATLVALVASKLLRGKIAPMLWLTTVLVCGFGALTVWSQNPTWIRHKPTAVYLLFAAALLWGWARGRPTLRTLLESAFEGLSEEGWMKLSRNWAFFFLFLAALNEVFARSNWFTFDEWLRAKLVVFLPLSFLFTFAHMPMLLRHGLGKDAQEDVLANPPHE
jgi:intracellular septation protein